MPCQEKLPLHLLLCWTCHLGNIPCSAHHVQTHSSGNFRSRTHLLSICFIHLQPGTCRAIKCMCKHCVCVCVCVSVWNRWNWIILFDSSLWFISRVKVFGAVLIHSFGLFCKVRSLYLFGTVHLFQSTCSHSWLCELFCDQQILHKGESILRDPKHALYVEFKYLPHGHQFRSLAHKANRRGDLFPLQFISSTGHDQPSELC